MSQKSVSFSIIFHGELIAVIPLLLFFYHVDKKANKEDEQSSLQFAWFDFASDYVQIGFCLNFVSYDDFPRIIFISK